MRSNRLSDRQSASALGSASALALMMTFATPASASSRIDLDYRVPPGCPAEAAFRAEVERRLAHAPPRDKAVKVKIRVTLQHGKSVGVLELNGDEASRRTVSDPVCSNVVQALTLIVAVALGGDATSRWPQLPTEPRPRVRSRARAASEGSSPLHVIPTLGVQLTAATPIAPGVVFGPSAFAGARLETPGKLAWALRAAVEHASSGVTSSGLAAARFAWTAARLDGCLSFSPLGPVELNPCFTSHVGVLEAEGVPTSTILHTRSASSLWLSMGVLARLRVLLLPALALEAQGSLEANVRRRQFRFQAPDSELYQTPLFGVFTGVGVAAELP